LKHHTIILVPHARARFRKWRVNNLQIGVALTAAALLTLGTCFVLWSFLTTSVDQDEVAQMKGENERLRQVQGEFELSLQRLQSQLSEYEERTRKLAIVAGLDVPVSGEPGIGGAIPDLRTDDESGVLTATSQRVSTLADQLDRVERQFEERRRWLSATPTIAPVKGLLTSWFGSRKDPINHNRENHPAIDIAAAPGKPVIATADGLVTRSGEGGDGLGISVSLSHGYGMTTRYGHLSRVAARQGQTVRRGDVIGFVGSTGRSTGYHLHYEVLLDGQAVDPLVYILDGTQGGES
jgi:murein DD-endopeptidase MepM/ murein hydrolase activator NlpD